MTIANDTTGFVTMESVNEPFLSPMCHIIPVEMDLPIYKATCCRTGKEAEFASAALFGMNGFFHDDTPLWVARYGPDGTHIHLSPVQFHRKQNGVKISSESGVLLGPLVRIG